MFISIRWRLVASHVLLTLLTVSVAGLLGLWGIRYTSQQQEIQYLTNTARAIALQAESLISSQADSEQLVQLVQTASFFSNVQVRILDAQDRVIADSGLAGQASDIVWFVLPHHVVERFESPVEGFFIAPAPPRIPMIAKDAYPFPEDLAKVRLTIVRRVDGPWGGHFEMEPFPSAPAQLNVREIPSKVVTRQPTRTIRVPIGAGRDPLGSVELSSFSNAGFGAMTSSWPAFLLASGGSIALALTLGLVLGNRLSKPITSLNQAARVMGAGELSIRAPVQGKDEIGELATQFNAMATQLEASFTQLSAERDTLRRFIADASHELRTPITALQNFNDLLLESAGDDPRTRAEFLEESRQQIERMTRITQNLLDLSRLESGLSSLEITAQDIGEVMKGFRSQFEPRASQKDIHLEFIPVDDHLVISCDPGKLEMALANLLDNALKFVPGRSRVTVGVEKDGEMIRFRVEDDGPGIHPDDLPHVFERFYRGRNIDQPGSGLGLSIVQSVALAHGGRAWVESELDHGSKFYLEIPCVTS